MNIETAAQAVYREIKADPDEYENECAQVRQAYARTATAAIDAYRTLTDAQWADEREKVAGAIYRSRGYTGTLFTEQDRDTAVWYREAEAAMRALGFRRSGDDT